MPTSSSSYGQFLGNSKSVGYKLYLAAAFGTGTPTVTIPADEDLSKDRTVMNSAYAIAVLSAMVSVLSTVTALVTLFKLKMRPSFAAAVLLYETFAGLARAFLLLMFAPMTFGPTFYNGMSHFQDMVTNMLLSPVGHFSTILTSLVWLKFSIVRQEKRWHNISIALLTVVIVSISFYASTSFMNVYKREGILAVRPRPKGVCS